MALLSLLAVAAEEGGGEISPFAVNFGIFFWTWIVFGILLFVLWKYAFPAILKATEDRERAIAKQLDEASKANTDAKAMLDENRRLLAGNTEILDKVVGLEKRILELETQFSECERQYNERVLPKTPKEDEATATAEPEVEVALSEKGKTLKKQQGQLFGQLSRSCDNDLSTIHEICGAIGLGDLGRVTSALAMVTASERSLTL